MHGKDTLVLDTRPRGRLRLLPVSILFLLLSVIATLGSRSDPSFSGQGTIAVVVFAVLLWGIILLAVRPRIGRWTLGAEGVGEILWMGRRGRFVRWDEVRRVCWTLTGIQLAGQHWRIRFPGQMLSKLEREELRVVLRKYLGDEVNLDDRPRAYTMLRRTSVARIVVAATIGNVWLVGLTVGAIYDPEHYLRWARLSFEMAGVMMGIAVVAVFVGVLLTPAEVRRGVWRERRGGD